MKRVIIVGGGFAGLNAAKVLGRHGRRDVDVTLIDRRNHHLFQPLLYQVATAGLSPADIAAPIRSILHGYRNVRVLQGEVRSVDFDARRVVTDFGELEYDDLLLACGSWHSYFGHEEWEEFAPGLKTVEQATEIRRRILKAFEVAERTTDPTRRRALLTFVIVGGGPTGVELAGAIGEMSRYTLAKDFRTIDSKSARVILIEAGPRILSTFHPEQSSQAMRDLEGLGVQVWTNSLVTNVDDGGVCVGEERIQAATVLWAAGVQAARISQRLGVATDRQGRIVVDPDLSIPGHRDVFVAGDLAHFAHQTGQPLPGVAPAAIQQGRFVARNILREARGQPREDTFHYADKGQMATIGRSRAIAEVWTLKLKGFVAWLIWLVVHIYYLTGFRNRVFVVLQWAWSYLTYRRGARLIVEKEWRSAELAAGAACADPLQEAAITSGRAAERDAAPQHVPDSPEASEIGREER